MDERPIPADEFRTMREAMLGQVPADQDHQGVVQRVPPQRPGTARPPVRSCYASRPDGNLTSPAGREIVG